MIDIEKYAIILQEGLLLDHYFLLCNIRDGKPLVKSKRIQGFINLLHKKGYVEEDVLTDKALRILGGEMILKPETPRIRVPQIEEGQKMDYADWVIQLHRKCESRLVEKTGKRQVRDKIDGKPYSFLPNPTDLGRAILKAVNTYKLRDYDKIESTILSYIDKCATAKQWFPLLQYYIMKNNQSPMVTDMDSDDEVQDDTTVNI